ncbi:MAG TPA: HEAT repeat domain-containing protein [Vicinamibacterales bacterium]|nr:HEAT repeat domain-containing protein [Vicinamibacterales bacterium]
MELGIRSPLLDFFKRGEVAKDVRLLAARGALAPRAQEQIALLAILTEDSDPEVRSAATTTLAAIPGESLAMFLGKPDVPDGLKDFFRGRGIEPIVGGETTDEPLVDIEVVTDQPVGEPVNEVEDGEEDAERQGAAHRLGLMGIAGRMKAAMKGTKEERAILIRDPNKLVSVSVLSSPKLTESEVENFAKLGSVSEEILRIIGQNRAWVKNYGVVSALAKNPKTPLGVSLNFVQRLNEKDLKLMAMDRNLQQPLKLAVRKRLVKPDKT